MKHITCYLDFISPFAWLAFEKLPDTLMGLSFQMDYKPILFAAMLKHHGQLGPAEIPGKREWTYRQVLWLARQHGVPLQMPASHPFNPLGLLRLAVACGHDGFANRFVCERLFSHVWQGGLEAADAQRLQSLTEELAPHRPVNSDAVKAELKANTDEAIARGVFGVPTFLVDGKLFWGFDALPMLRDCLLGEGWSEADWVTGGQVGSYLR
jgi:2-hydroxychromene-2-carboxylate isomerase